MSFRLARPCLCGSGASRTEGAAFGDSQKSPSPHGLTKKLESESSMAGSRCQNFEGTGVPKRSSSQCRSQSCWPPTVAEKLRSAAGGGGAGGRMDALYSIETLRTRGWCDSVSIRAE